MGKNRQSTKTPLPTPGELRLLQILWRIGEGTVDDIVRASGEDPPPNYKTVQAWLRIMEGKGQVDHRRKGRALVFWPWRCPPGVPSSHVDEVLCWFTEWIANGTLE